MVTHGAIFSLNLEQELLNQPCLLSKHLIIMYRQILMKCQKIIFGSTFKVKLIQDDHYS